MKEHSLSRRGFLQVASAGAATLAAAKTLSFGAFKEQAYAAEESTSITNCACCSFGCALRIHSKNGRLVGVEGVSGDPTSGGRPCARGYGWTDIAYTTEGRVLTPQKRNEDGTYSSIPWDQAFTEIAERLHKVVDTYGPESVACVSGVGGTQSFYANRFINAVGSSNTYGVTGACKVSHDVGWILGAGAEPSTDLANADYIIFIGRSPADGVNPAQIATLSARHASGKTHYVFVDPRLNSSSRLFDEWLPIRPATDLAFILALSHVVVKEDLYNHEFIEQYTTDFEEYVAALESYTPEWAEKITDIPAETITRIAREVATAEHGVLEHGFRGGLGVAYGNNVQTARAMAYFNALLGTYNVKGGLITKPGGVTVGGLDPQKFLAPTVVDNPYGHEEYPIPPAHTYLNNLVPVGAARGDLHAAFYYGTNPVLSHGNPVKVEESLRKLDLLVVVEIRWSETAAIADYVLPEATYLEQNRGLRAASTTVYELKQAIDKVHSETKTGEDIFRGLAQAYGVSEYFAFTQEDRIVAGLTSLGKTREELNEKELLTFPEKATDLSVGVFIKTANGKINFVSEQSEALGLGRVIKWIPPFIEPDDESFRIIAGNNPQQSHTYGFFSPTLRQITKDEKLEGVWINASRAAQLGISDGDTVEIYSDTVSRKTFAHVTEGINPHALFISSNYGSHQEKLGAAADNGIAFMDFTTGDLDPISSAPLTQENSVKIRKVVA